MNITEYIEQNKTPEQSIDEARKSIFGKGYMFFFDKDSGECRSVFVDANCEATLPNPLQADAEGNFPAFHFEPDTKSCYRVEIQNNRAESILKASLTQDAYSSKEEE